MLNNFTNHDIALISYGYALRIADEAIKEENINDISNKKLNILRTELARDIIKSVLDNVDKELNTNDVK